MIFASNSVAVAALLLASISGINCNAVEMTQASHSQPILMPWEKHSVSGFQVPTELKASKIPGGGVGRFAKVRMATGHVVHRTARASIDDFIAAEKAGSQENVAIEITPEGLSNLTGFLKAGGGKDVDKYISWFVAESKGLTFLLGHSFHVNHPLGGKVNANARFTMVHPDSLEVQSIRDIEVGDEIYIDYTSWDIPDYFKSWCRKRNVVDARTFAEQLEHNIHTLAKQVECSNTTQPCRNIALI